MSEATRKTLLQKYLLGVWVLKIRLISSRRQLWANDTSLIHLENGALQLRKMCEMLAYLCVAISGLKSGELKKSRRGYQVGEVLSSLESNKNLNFPRQARLTLVDEETNSQPQRWKLDISDAKPEDVVRLRKIYEQTHKILHEFSPFRGFPLPEESPQVLASVLNAMRADHQWLWNQFWQHAVFIDKSLLFINLGADDEHSRPTIVKSENLDSGEVAVDFDPDFLADFSGKVMWSDYENNFL